MCLRIKKQNYCRTSTRDIIVYKILRVESLDNDVFRTAFRGFEVKIGSCYFSEIELTKQFFSVHTKYGEIGVEKALHSFANVNDTIRVKNILYSNNTILFVVKCTIPKGSRYYRGKFNEFDSYASDRLIYNEIISV